MIASPTHLFDTPAKAEAMVARLTADEVDGWTYRVVPAGARARVAIHEPNGAFVGYL